MDTYRTLLASLRLLREETDGHVARNFVMATGLVLTGGLLAGLGPLALKALIDALSGTGRSSNPPGSATYLWLAAGYLGVVCSGKLFAELQMPLVGIAEQRLHARMRRRFLGHLLRLDTGFHNKRGTGTGAKELEQAIVGYQLIVFAIVHGVLPVLAEVGTLLLVLGSLDQAGLVAIVALTAIAYGVAIHRQTALLSLKSRNVVRASLDAHGLFTDFMVNLDTIRCFNAEPSVSRRYGEAIEDLERSWRELHAQRARLGIAMATIFSVSMAAALAISIHALMLGTLSIGGLVLVNLSMAQLLRPMEALGGAVREMSTATELVRPFLAVLAEPIDPAESTDPASTAGTTCACMVEGASPARRISGGPSPSPAIRFCEVRFAYERLPVLNGLNLDIAPGRTVAIVGGSGSGKSSLLKLMLRLYEPQAGSILIDDRPATTRSAAEVRSLIGLVSQDPALFNDTIADNVRIGNPVASSEELEEAARIACVHDFVMTLPAKYETIVGERGLRLSGGERQRVAIARAILKRPLIYALDEATSMLDGVTEGRVLSNIRRVAVDRTLILIAHRLSSIQDFDEIVVMDAGRVVERGSHAALMLAAGAYARLWDAQHHRRT